MIGRVPAPERHGVLPVETDADSAPYWSGLAEGRLRLPHCRSCDRSWSPPAPRCPRCGAEDPDWVEVDGDGSVYSWVVVRRALDEAFSGDLPYTIAVVELDGADGARVVGRLLPFDLPVQPGSRVRTVVYDVGGRSLPAFVAEDSWREGNPA